LIIKAVNYGATEKVNKVERDKNYPKKEEVKKMNPRVEDYIDTTCVASTGGKMFYEY